MSGQIASLLIMLAGVLLSCMGWFLTQIIQLKQAVAILLLQVNGQSHEKSLRELIHDVQIELGRNSTGNPGNS